MNRPRNYNEYNDYYRKWSTQQVKDNNKSKDDGDLKTFPLLSYIYTDTIKT